jgi:predicted NAD/FAD-dependent oxidoreductase
VTTLRHVAVVGAGLAGLRAAEAVLSSDEEARVSLLTQLGMGSRLAVHREQHEVALGLR